MTKAPYTSRKSQKGKVITQTTPQKSSITQRLRTDLGRSVGVTTATQLVWLSGLRAQPSHSPQQPCNQKDTYLKICKSIPYIDNKPTSILSGDVIKIDTRTTLVINIIYQKYIQWHPNRAGYSPPVWKRAQVWWLKESRLTTRGDEDQDLVASEKFGQGSSYSPHRLVSQSAMQCKGLYKAVEGPIIRPI